MSCETVQVPFDSQGLLDYTVDIYSYLLKDRIIFLSDVVNKKLADSIIAKLIYLESKADKEDINIYINSAGGSLTSFFAIYDTMNLIKSPIRTVCLGEAFSGAALILSGGTKGKRTATENSYIMVHEPLGGYVGSATDSEYYYRYFIEQRDNLAKVLSEVTGNDLEKIKEDISRDRYMSAEEALKYGIIDEILKEQ